MMSRGCIYHRVEVDRSSNTYGHCNGTKTLDFWVKYIYADKTVRICMYMYFEGGEGCSWNGSEGGDTYS